MGKHTIKPYLHSIYREIKTSDGSFERALFEMFLCAWILICRVCTVAAYIRSDTVTIGGRTALFILFSRFFLLLLLSLSCIALWTRLIKLQCGLQFIFHSLSRLIYEFNSQATVFNLNKLRVGLNEAHSKPLNKSRWFVNKFS